MVDNLEKVDLLRFFLQSSLKLRNVGRGSIWVKQKKGYSLIFRAMKTGDIHIPPPHF